MSVSVGGPSKATAGGGDATTDTDPDAGVGRTAIDNVVDIATCNGEAGGEGREGGDSNKLTWRKPGGGGNNQNGGALLLKNYYNQLTT